MFLRIFFFFIGIILTVFSMMNLILYLNLLSIGYTFFEYIKFIITRIECICLGVGLIIIFMSISKFRRNNEIHLWYYFKF